MHHREVRHGSDRSSATGRARDEGGPNESDEPGTLELVAESTHESLLKNADNITIAPWGDLIVCEDTSDHCGIVGIRDDGSQYQLADNPYSDSSLAGVCFSPDGKTMFFNIQYPGTTVAVTGDFPPQRLISSSRGVRA